MRDLRQIHGFTLVELAVALTIIGLLLGGVLKGQTMMENARVKAVIKRHSEYSAALTGFRSKYSQLPGDMANATLRVPNCTAANNCANGNGNGIIGVATTVSIVVDDSTFPLTSAWPGATETAQFWKHLAMADLIGGVNLSAPVGKDVNQWGETHPASPLKGGVFVGSGNSVVNAGVKTGPATPGWPYFGFAGSLATAQPATSPKLALQIDRQIDDGNPLSGDVIIVGFQPGCQTWVSGGPLGDPDVDETSTNVLCNLALRYR